MVKTRTSSGAAPARVVTGTYSGDGAATQGIIGVGFQPIALIVYEHTDIPYSPGFKVTQDGVWAWFYYPAVNSFVYLVDMIISLDADGFTVGDGTGDVNRFNILDEDYTYIAWG